MGQRPEHDLLYRRPGFPDRIQLAHQRMERVNFVVSVSADQHQVLQIRPGQQVFKQIERRRVEPLQIVEKQSKRMLRPREHSDKSSKDEPKSALRVLKRKFRHRRLFADRSASAQVRGRS